MANGSSTGASCRANARADVLFEDDEVVVVAKPAGVYVHASPGHETGSLADALAASRPGMRSAGSAERPGVVHRLDADTSGVMVFANTQRAYLPLPRACESHRGVVKKYLAVLHGAPKERSGTLETPIGRKPWDPKRMAVVEPGQRDARPAVTHWTVLARRGGLSLVEFVIETGRTHQIRVHAAHLGAPIVGDPLYGDAAKDRRLGARASRTLLHAVELTFPHPATGKPMTFAAIPPPDIMS